MRFVGKVYDIEIIDGITTITFFVKPDLSDIKNAMDEEIVRSVDSRLRLWYMQAGIDLPSEKIKEIARYAKEHLPTFSRAAIVAADDLSFGLMRLGDVHREQEHHITRVFRTKDEAILWLKSAT